MLTLDTGTKTRPFTKATIRVAREPGLDSNGWNKVGQDHSRWRTGVRGKGCKSKASFKI